MGQNPKAFLLYSEADEAAVRRLRRKLENYVVPQRLRAGGPAKLGRFIPDRRSARLGDTAQQMAAVDWLIVLSSPNSFGSERVNADIDTYLVSNPVGRFLMVVLDGEPMQVLPPRLRAREPVTADLQANADGQELGFLKLVSALTGANVGALRDHQAAVARTRGYFGLALTGVLAVASALGALASVAAYHERTRAEAMTQRAIDLAADMAAHTDESGALLHDVEQRFDALFADGPRGPDFIRQRAHVLVRLAEAYARGGDAERARERALAAIEALDALPERGSIDLMRALSLASVGVSGADALAYAERAVEAGRATMRGGDSAEARAVFSEALGKLGAMYVGAGRTAEALPLFAEAAPLLQSAYDASPDDDATAARLNEGLRALGGAQAVTGDHAGARASFERLVALTRARAERSPGNQEARRALGSALANLAQTLAANNDYAAARAPSEESLAIARQLSAANPDDNALRQEMSSRLIGTARVQAALGRATPALMEEAIAAARAGAEGAPDDIPAQTTLAELFAADAARHERARDFEKARDAWREGAQVRRRLRTLAHDSPAAIAAHAEVLEHIADTSARLNDRTGTLAAFTEVIRARRAIVTAAPSDKSARAALATALHNSALARLRADNDAGARAAFEEAARIRATLAEEDAADQAIADQALASLQQLLRLQREADAATGVRRTLTTMRDIQRRLASAHPDNARYAAALRRTEAALAAEEAAR